MSYSFFINNLLLPIPPEKITTKTVNKNETINLVDGSELNILRSSGLTEIEFDFLLPSDEYPFANYVGGFISPNEFLEKFEYIKNNKQSAKFTIIRSKGFGNTLFNLNMRVSIEDYQITEQYDNGFDILVSIKLKQFDNIYTKSGTIDKDGNVIVDEQRAFFENTSESYIMKNGDDLFDVCHMMLGDGDLCTEIATKNGYSSPLDVKGGTLIRFDV